MAALAVGRVGLPPPYYMPVAHGEAHVNVTSFYLI